MVISGISLLGDLGPVMACHIHTSLTVDGVSNFGNPSPILRLGLRIHKECENVLIIKSTILQVSYGVL